MTEYLPVRSRTMTETKQEQIERLQNNDLGFYALPKEDQAFMNSLVETGKDIVYKTSVGKDWSVRSETKTLLSRNSIYRIHKDYQPEPDKLVFPGYVLCEVFLGTTDSRQYFGLAGGGVRLLSQAIDYGCCGYIVKEDPDMVYESPIRWVREGGKSTYPACSIKTKMKPATLGWVVFLEVKDD